ncbi:FRG domain-containing protein [Candidatus Berkiella aquae]|uniref:FRG domain protein n=1 Tax=Candidatus Berkiella aquae TaxID=295108 RepID=A0A0Q9Z0U8_9GAMM|nr:FRG domain-containing protein [Candidatus Berkiella aquae]MCS5711959.1 FRG domain-containing protein [Candidatus Berkiella aquae]
MRKITPGNYEEIPPFTGYDKFVLEKHKDFCIPVSKLELWSEFLHVTNDGFLKDQDRNFIFRGHSDSNWILSSTLYRLCNNLNAEKADDILNKFSENLKESNLDGKEKYAKDLIGSQLWFLGRHHGLMTPLLDWTYDSKTALYFAFEDITSSSKGQYSAIYFFDVKKAKEQLGAKIEFQDCLCPDNTRVLNQKGLFTLTEKYLPIECFLDEGSHEYFRKIYIKRTDSKKCIEHLDEKGISKRTLYPDSIEGVVQYCNQYAQKYYARTGGGQLVAITQETIDIIKEKCEIQEWLAENLDSSNGELKLESVVNLVQKIFSNFRKKACTDPVKIKAVNEVYTDIFKTE